MDIVAAVSRGVDRGFSIETVSLDEPREDEILVRVAGVGLCHTDLVFKSAGLIAAPAVFGHEGAGVVERVGRSVTKVAPGDRVAMTFRSCGECPRCRKREPAYCHTMPMLNYTGVRIDGSRSISANGEAIAGNFFGQSSFASHALAYERNVVKLPDDVPLELMGPLGCSVQTGAGGVMRSLACEAGSSILILGGGAVGLSAVMGARIQGCATVIVLEPHEARRQLALELGATHTLDPKAITDVIASVRAIVPIGVDYAFDTTGIPTLLEAATACLGPHGTFGIVGIPPQGTPMPGDVMTAVTFGHTIKGIIEGDSDPDTFIPELIEHFRGGRLPFDRLIRTYPIAQINQAIADQQRGDVIKIVCVPDEH